MSRDDGLPEFPEAALGLWGGWPPPEALGATRICRVCEESFADKVGRSPAGRGLHLCDCGEWHLVCAECVILFGLLGEGDGRLADADRVYYGPLAVCPDSVRLAVDLMEGRDA
ncbi:MAG TPA: hypothetical protein VMZ50_04930 [Phycisphaerae bacterium]|nr:hypothetical protein [Phycisphaerae bacterium]